MTSRAWSCAILVVACAWCASAARAQPLIAPTEALSPAEQQKRFHLPPGFEIQLVASEPAIHKPMNLSFDAAGRLFVTDTLEYPFPAAPGAVPRDSVKILVDRNFDGAADEVTTFVDRLNIPLGVMPIPGGVIVYGIPSIQRCLDTDGDGQADTRDTLYADFGHRDTHGMVNSFTRGLDGWLYACHGFANDSTPKGSDGRSIAMNSGNTFRMRVDGSHVEYHTHGQVNPFGLAFDPLGNLYSADCHTMPIYMLLRGAYYPSFGKAHDGLGFGPTMIGHDHHSTGIGGIAYYAAEQFPPEYRDTILIGNPVTGRVNHDRLLAHGSTYEAVELPDFVSCDDPWFRPVNLQVGPDGALYIADFYNCIIGHYEVELQHPRRDRERGRIWRVVYTGRGVEQPAKTAPPIPTVVSQAPQRRLIELLGDGNLTVRTLATHELVDRIGPPAVEPLRALLASPASTPWQRVHGMWALWRLEGLEPEMLQRLTRDADAAVRVHAIKLLAEQSWDENPLALEALSDPDAFVRRAAADALARHPRIEHVPPLLALWRSTPAEDTHLVHVARMALRDQLLSPGAYAALSTVVGDERDDLARLADVSLGVPNAEAASFLWARLKADPSVGKRETFLHHVVRHIQADELPQVYTTALGWQDLDASQQVGALLAVGRATQERGSALPADVLARAEQLAATCLAADSEAHVRSGIDLARELKLPVFEQLAHAADPAAAFASLRPAAIDACVTNDPNRAVPVLAGILADAREPVNLRQHTARALARVNDASSRDALVANLQTAPERLAVEIASVLAESPAGAEELLSAVSSGKASARLLQEQNVVRRLGARGLKNLNERLTQLTAGLPPEDERIGALIADRRRMVNDGQSDPTLGAAIFEKHCMACHRIGDKGAKVGPNLDGVGVRGLDRLLEDILDPSRNVDQAFRTTQIVTTDGRIIIGLALREEGEILVLADAQGKELRVPKQEIEERTVSQLSVMPSNVPDLVTEAEFVHLIGYLLAQRAQQQQPQ